MEHVEFLSMALPFVTQSLSTVLKQFLTIFLISWAHNQRQSYLIKDLELLELSKDSKAKDLFKEHISLMRIT